MKGNIKNNVGNTQAPPPPPPSTKKGIKILTISKQELMDIGWDSIKITKSFVENLEKEFNAALDLIEEKSEVKITVLLETKLPRIDPADGKIYYFGPRIKLNITI